MSGWLRRNADLIATGLILLAMSLGSAAGNSFGLLNRVQSWGQRDLRPQVLEMPRWNAPVWRFRVMRASEMQRMQQLRLDMRNNMYQNLNLIRGTTERARREALQLGVDMVRLRRDVRSALCDR